MSLLARFVVFSCLALVAGGVAYWYSWVEDEREAVIERSVDLRLLALSDPTACMEELTRLREDGKITPDDLVLWVELSLEVPGFSPDKEALSELEELLPGSPEVLVLQANLQYHEGQVPGSVEKLRAVLDDHKDDPRARYVMHKILWVRGLVEDRLRAKRGLLELAQKGDEWGYKALRVLVFSRPGPAFLKSEMIEAIEDLRTHPLVTSTDFLKACALDLTIDKELAREDIINRAVAAVPNPVREEDLGQWLVGLNENEKVLSLVSQDSATRNPSLFLIRFQALLQAKRTEDAVALLARAKAVLPQEESLRASVFIAICRGDEKAFETFHKEAVSLGSVQSLLEVSRLGLLAGKGGLVLKAFEQAWAMDPNAFGLDQANQFLQIALATGRTKLAHQITGSAKERFPYKYGNLNNHCYLSLLMGEDPEILEREAERIVLAFPSNPSFLSTLALAKVLVGKPQDAFEAMRARGATPMVHGERALMAVILNGVGKQEDARKLAKDLRAEKMLPEEWALLRRAGDLR